MMKVKKTLQLYFKRRFQLLFKLIYGNIELEIDLSKIKNVTKKKLRTSNQILRIQGIIIAIK